MKNYGRSKYLFRIFLALIPFMAVSVAHSQSSPEPVELQLKTAMAMAIRNNLDLRVDALDSSIAEASLQSNRGIYDPFLSMSAGYDETLSYGEYYGTKGASTSLGVAQYLASGGSISASARTSETKPYNDPDYEWTDWYSSASITFTQPLLKNFGKETTELSISLAANSHEGSIERFRDSVIDTVYTVIKGYNRLNSLQQVLDARQRALTSAGELLTDIKKSQESSAKDLALANTEYTISQRQKDLVDAEGAIKDQEARLLYLIGVEKRLKLKPVDPPSREEPMETGAQAIALAMENGPFLKQLRLDLQASELQERVAKRGLLPSLSISTSVGLRGVEDTVGESFQQLAEGTGSYWSASLQFSMPLGNSVAKGNYRRNKLRTSQIKNRLAAAEWSLRDDIEEDLRSLMSTRIQIQVADKAVKISEQRVEQYRKSVARNQSKVLDLLNVENDLVVARSNQTEALENFSNAVALLWKDTGVLLERKNINVNVTQPDELTGGFQGFPSPISSPNENSAQKTEKNTPFVASPLIPQKKVQQPITVSTVAPLLPAAQKLVDKSGAVKGTEYTLKIGEFASSELSATQKKVKTAGLMPLVSVGPEQPRLVIRLNAGDYQDRQTAQEELRKLREAHAEGFILNRGKAGYRVYAGSFFGRNGALKEKQRLVALGADLSLEEVSVMLPTSLLAAGQFSSREAALAGAAQLKKLGVKSVVQKKV